MNADKNTVTFSHLWTSVFSDDKILGRVFHFHFVPLGRRLICCLCCQNCLHLTAPIPFSPLNHPLRLHFISRITLNDISFPSSPLPLVGFLGRVVIYVMHTFLWRPEYYWAAGLICSKVMQSFFQFSNISFVCFNCIFPFHIIYYSAVFSNINSTFERSSSFLRNLRNLTQLFLKPKMANFFSSDFTAGLPLSPAADGCART